MHNNPIENLCQSIASCPLAKRALHYAPLLLAFTATTLPAQKSAFEVEGPVKMVTPAAHAESYQFSPPAQAVVARLASFAYLPSRDWQYHEGDLANGQDPSAGSAAWQNVTIPFVASKQGAWLRKELVVPPTFNGYDLTGASLSFYMPVSGDDPGRDTLYETIYCNGKLIAEGAHLYKEILASDLRPGEKLLIVVKMPATNGPKRITTGLANGVELDSVRLQLLFSPARPDPEVLNAELVSAAGLLPQITHDPAALAAQEKILDAAAASVDLKSLDAGNQQAFDASLQSAQAALDPLRPILKQAYVVMTANAHIDAAWLWTKSETIDQVHFTFKNALELMHEYPQLTFSQSAAQYYEWIEQKFPILFAQIQQYVKEGRWEVVGGMWVEPDLNLPDGESEVRQLLIGKRYFQQKFGVDVKIGWNPDSFGFNWQLPQVYKKSGIDYFVTQKLNYNDQNHIPLKLFWWQSPDGSRVLTYFPFNYIQHTLPISVAQNLADSMKTNPGNNALLHLYGPSLGRLDIPEGRSFLQEGIQWSDPAKVFPAARFDTSAAFFADMARRADTANPPIWSYKTFAAGVTQLPPALNDGKIHLPVWNDELYLERHRGTYTTQAGEKANIRHSEEWLLDAEKFSALAWLGGLDYPGSQFTESWKLKLFDDFHDSAAGTAIAQDYRDAQTDYDSIHRVTGDATRVALHQIESRINTSAHPGVPIIVWNQLNWTRTEAVPVTVQMPAPQPNGISVVDAAGKPVLMQILSTDSSTNTYQLLIEAPVVPSVGYKVLYVVPGRRTVPTDLQLHGITLENSQLRVVLDPATGCITSLISKKSGFESLAPGACGNQLQAFKDDFPGEDAWDIPYGYEKHGANLDMLDSIKVVQQGPLRESIRITRTWSKSKFVQDIVLEAGSPRVDIVSNIDWHETQVLLKAAFPLAFSSPSATYEIPYGSIERPTARSNSVDNAKFEVPALKWADLGGAQNGFSLLNDSKYGYDALHNVLRLTLLRSPIFPDPDADRGHHSFTYSLYPHAGTWKSADTVLRGYELNFKLSAAQIIPHTGQLPPAFSFVSIKPENLVLTAIKKSEDGNSLILRFYEWAGRQTDARIAVPAGATSASETNLMEQEAASAHAILALSGNAFALPVVPYSINTVRVDYANRGPAFWQAQK
jgi:alpha-mannosidase